MLLYSSFNLLIFYNNFVVGVKLFLFHKPTCSLYFFFKIFLYKKKNLGACATFRRMRLGFFYKRPMIFLY